MGQEDDSAATVTCQTCGFNLPADASFCGYDGAKLNGLNAAKKTQMMQIKKKCSECSKEYPGYAKFCGIDGTDLYAIPIPASVTEPAVKELVAEEKSSQLPIAS